MPWAKLDDGFWSNPKVLAAGNEAAGVYARCIAYCAAHLTDGRVPSEVVKFMAGSSRKVVPNLLANGLLEEGSSGFQIPDYLVYNPSKEEVQKKRKADAKRQAEHRSRKKSPDESRRDTSASRAAPSRPLNGERSSEPSRGEEEFSSLRTLSAKDSPTRIEAVFIEWGKAAGKRPGDTVLDPKRRRVIANALKLAPLDMVLAAARGWVHSPHNRGENDRGRPFNELSVVLRDREQIELFAGMDARHGQPEEVPLAPPPADLGQLGKRAADRLARQHRQPEPEGSAAA